MSIVRFAESADIPALIELGRQMHVQSRYGWMTFASSRVWQYLEKAIPNKQFCVIVATESVGPATSTASTNPALSACLIANVSQFPFCYDFCAQVDYLYVAPAKRGSPMAMKMLTAFKRWAANRDVTEITIPNRFGANDAKTAKLISKLGMPVVGGVHAMWVDRK
jgi:hypothetical protein